MPLGYCKNMKSSCLLINDSYLSKKHIFWCKFKTSQEAVIERLNKRGPTRGVPGIPYSFKYFEKYPISLKRNGQISPKFTPLQKVLYHNIPNKGTWNFHKSIPYPFKYFTNTPISIKTLQVPHKRW